MNTKMLCGGPILLTMVLLPALLRGQDTLRLSLPDSEKMFVEKNLSLLAARYQIDETKAGVIQARLFPNPTLELSGNIYNPDRQKFADISNRTGQYTASIQQLIRLAGKRNKEIRLAETQLKMAESQFEDLLRTLRLTLRSNFYKIHFLYHSLNAYNNQIGSLEKLSGAYDDLHAKGIVTLKDALRIKSLLYSLKAEQTSLENELNDLQSELQLLLHANGHWIMPLADKRIAFTINIRDYAVRDLIDTAFHNRHDLKLSEYAAQYAQQNYSLQKALAKPDLTLGAEFDKRGSFVDNGSFLRAAIDLPFFHRNQGNIQAARAGIEKASTLASQQKLLVEKEVRTAYARALNTGRMLQSLDAGFEEQYEKILSGISENFQKKNISLLEFTDFNESYKDNILQFNQLQNDFMQAIEDLQFAVGKTLFNY